MKVTLVYSFTGPSAQSQTLNYYAQYYAAIAAQQQEAVAPVPQQQASNGQMPGQVNAAPVAQPASGGEQDYTQQWIEYYRAYGMHKEADQIEAMAKASKGQNSSHEGNGTDKPAVSYPNVYPYGSK
jgi:far upstream element-binding protein